MQVSLPGHTDLSNGFEVYLFIAVYAASQRREAARQHPTCAKGRDSLSRPILILVFLLHSSLKHR